MKKSPVLAAILNFLVFGGGTLYNGRRKLVALLMILGGNMAQAVEIKVSPIVDNSVPTLWPFLISGLVLVKLASAVDGWLEAKRLNSA